MPKKQNSYSKNTPNVRKAWGITRVSTEKQNFGIQDINIHRYLTTHPELDYQDVYQIKQSAYSLTPKRLSKIVNELPRHSALILSKIDRLTRNINDFSKFKEIIVNKDLEIHFIQEQIVWNSATPRETEHIIWNYIAAAEEYSIDLSKKVKDGNYVKRQLGEITYSAPLGYQNYSEGRIKGWKIHPETGKLVKELFEMYSTGRFSFSQLADYAYRKGLTGRISKNNGTHKKLTKQAIINILTNKFYIGLAKFDKKTYKHKYEKLISKELFDKCQAVYHNKCRVKTPAKSTFVSPFCGLIRDAVSNKLYSPYSQKGKNYLKSPVLGQKDLKEKNFYNGLIKILGKLSDNTKLAKFLEDSLNTSANIAYELLLAEQNTQKKDKQQYEKQLNSLLMTPPPSARPEQINSAIGMLNKRIDELNKKIQDTKAKLESRSVKKIDLRGNLVGKYQDLDTKSQHEILTRLFSGIKYKNGMVTFCLSEQAQQITQKQKFLFDYTRI